MREIQLPAGDEERREEWPSHLWEQRVRRAQRGRIHVRQHAQHGRARARGPSVRVLHARRMRMVRVAIGRRSTQQEGMRKHVHRYLVEACFGIA